jgi:hypothetical protein
LDDYGMARLGWHFFYGGDLCLVSRYPSVVLDVRNPDSAWERAPETIPSGSR